ncbi:hypothetical protein GCM10010174_37520 [Kutzneria viridogrisea]|uniref:TVP38/TMEM64 family membrane protein n=1 Tax=Kutzneria viridogrisea TaxID=47990 RepID=A0ABR6BTW2_9PSEU|nr:putative membrane protein YdjX (TVP38/TMEM64 family) [Kutzneria viridogrisea]
MPLSWWNRSPWPRLVLGVGVLGATGVVAATSGGAAVGLVRGWVDGLGVFGPLLFVLVYALASMVFLPLSVLAAVAGVLFGPGLSLPVVWLGSMLGAYGAFRLGRGLSREAVRELAGDRLARIDAVVARHGALAVFLLRLLPAGPFALLNYVASATAIGLRPFLLGNALGILPGVVVYTALGGSLGDLGSPTFLLAVGALLALVLGGGLALRRMARTAPDDHSASRYDV